MYQGGPGGRVGAYQTVSNPNPTQAPSLVAKLGSFFSGLGSGGSNSYSLGSGGLGRYVSGLSGLSGVSGGSGGSGVSLGREIETSTPFYNGYIPVNSAPNSQTPPSPNPSSQLPPIGRSPLLSPSDSAPITGPWITTTLNKIPEKNSKKNPDVIFSNLVSTKGKSAQTKTNDNFGKSVINSSKSRTQLGQGNSNKVISTSNGPWITKPLNYKGAGGLSTSGDSSVPLGKSAAATPQLASSFVQDNFNGHVNSGGVYLQNPGFNSYINADFNQGSGYQGSFGNTGVYSGASGPPQGVYQSSYLANFPNFGPGTFQQVPGLESYPWSQGGTQEQSTYKPYLILPSVTKRTTTRRTTTTTTTTTTTIIVEEPKPEFFLKDAVSYKEEDVVSYTEEDVESYTDKDEEYELVCDCTWFRAQFGYGILAGLGVALLAAAFIYIIPFMKMFLKRKPE